MQDVIYFPRITAQNHLHYLMNNLWPAYSTIVFPAGVDSIDGVDSIHEINSIRLFRPQGQYKAHVQQV